MRSCPTARRVLVVVALGLLALTGCADVAAPPDAPPADPGRTGAQTGGQTGWRTAGGAARTATRAPAVRQEIVDDLEDAVTSVEQYWAGEFAERGATFRPVRRVYAYTPGDGTDCGGEPNVPNNAAYCLPDDEIGFDIRWTARAYQQLGDAFVYYLIGHEYAHAVQRRLDTSFRFTIAFELQADCYAGAYLGDQSRGGGLILEEGDIEELASGLRAVADPEGTPWFDPRAHGTAEQRISYFARGFDGSLEDCP